MDNGSIVDAGAATFCSGATGCSGVVSASNSLVGSTASDRIGTNVRSLNTGNYVVSNSVWNNGAIVDAGAVTFGNGLTGTTGVVSPPTCLSVRRQTIMSAAAVQLL